MAEDQDDGEGNIFQRLMAGPRWGFINAQGEFVEVPKAPLIHAGFARRPPFKVTMPSGQVRNIVEEPQALSQSEP